MTLAVIWLAFAVLFAVLGRFFWKEANRSVSPFHVTRRAAGGTVELLGMDVDRPLVDFAQEFNAYLRDQNTSSARANRAASFSAYLAAATAILSALIALLPSLVVPS